jgi:hypothetical protein
MKRRDALRKARVVCQRLDELDLETFPIWPLKMYLFGSVLTDKPDPRDVDLALVYLENPKIKYSQEEILHMLSYEPRLMPHNRASVALRRGMKMIRLHMAPTSMENWEYLALFPDGEGIRLVWKPGLKWSAILDEIESRPTAWQGSRSEADEQRTKEEWEALPETEKRARKERTLAALERQEQSLE